jgi:HTH-type transcriptional regulator / antitoxin HigA
MNIKPIRNESDYREVLARVQKLWGAPAESKEGDELDVLATLIDAYEREQYPIDLPTPIDAIRFRLEQSGRTCLDLIGIIGRRERVYEVMRGARPLSLRMIRNLHRYLNIPADILIQPGKHKPRRDESLRRGSSSQSAQKKQQKRA